MKLDEIFGNWDEDSVINQAELGRESLKIPKLHHKYFRMFSNERLILRKIETDFKRLVLLKTEYYLGTLDADTMREKGWKPNPLRILKTDVQLYIDADPDIIETTLRIGVAKEKIDVLESILKNILNRGFQIKNALDYLKWTSGG